MKFDHALWGDIVPDGPRFCHCGGKRISKQLAKELKISAKDKVLDLCCGQGGLTDYLTKASLVIGIDTSAEAIAEAQKTARNTKTLFMTADARFLPFPDASFDKVISQDADAWMHADKKSLMREINRVLRQNGLFVWQSYATERSIQGQTRRVLKAVGYDFNNLPNCKELKKMFLNSGFSIVKSRSLHEIYSRDNILMLHKALAIKKLTKDKSINNYIQLLEHEKNLFKNKSWTGVLVIRKKLR